MINWFIQLHFSITAWMHQVTSIFYFGLRGESCILAFFLHNFFSCNWWDWFQVAMRQIGHNPTFNLIIFSSVLFTWTQHITISRCCKEILISVKFNRVFFFLCLHEFTTDINTFLLDLLYVHCLPSTVYCVRTASSLTHKCKAKHHLIPPSLYKRLRCFPSKAYFTADVWTRAGCKHWWNWCYLLFASLYYCS